VTVRVAFFALGVAAATAGWAVSTPAVAQETRADRGAAAAEVPWYERFTFSPGSPGNPGVVGLSGADRVAGWTANNPRAEGGSPAAARPSANWGVTFNVGEAERIEGAIAPEPRKETAVGAYFRFSPRVTVGGRVSLAEPKSGDRVDLRRTDREDPEAGVKLESAFRF